MSVLDQLTLAPPAVVGLHEVPMAEANALLTRWGHYLGPCLRPFHQEGWMLAVGDQPIAVAVSASTVAATCAGRSRGELVELARLCSGEPWATRVMLRLWREVCAPAWTGWDVAAAVAYSQNDRHEGRIYRFDGWTRVTTEAGTSGGGGTWTGPRSIDHKARGRKTLWLWRYGS